MYLNVYCQIFTVVSLDLNLIPLVVDSSLEVIKSLQEVNALVSTGHFGDLWSDLLAPREDHPLSFVEDFIRTLSYLVSSKAYTLTKSEPKKNASNTVETQILQSNILSGGIDPCFESEFSAQTQKLISQYTDITQHKTEAQSTSDYKTLVELITPIEGSDIIKAVDLLQKQYAKEKGPMLALIGREAGLRLSRATFAVLLKL